MDSPKCEYRATPKGSPSTSQYADNEDTGVTSGYWPGEYKCGKGLYDSVVTFCYGCPDMEKKDG